MRCSRFTAEPAITSHERPSMAPAGWVPTRSSPGPSARLASALRGSRFIHRNFTSPPHVAASIPSSTWRSTHEETRSHVDCPFTTASFQLFGSVRCRPIPSCAHSASTHIISPLTLPFTFPSDDKLSISQPCRPVSQSSQMDNSPPFSAAAAFVSRCHAATGRRPSFPGICNTPF